MDAGTTLRWQDVSPWFIMEIWGGTGSAGERGADGGPEMLHFIPVLD